MAKKRDQVRKQCNKCDEWKDKSHYYKRRRNIDGLANWCKVCADKATNKSRRRRVAKRVDSLQADAGS